MVREISVSTSSRVEFIDITGEVENIVRESRVSSGVCYIYVPHTTAAVTINENADPSVRRDIISELGKMVPFDDNYSHYEGNSAAHIKSSMIGPSEVVMIEGGRLLLGTWQGIYFCEFDGSRRRRVIVKVMEG